MIVSCCAYLLTSVSMNLRPLNWGLYLDPALAFGCRAAIFLSFGFLNSSQLPPFFWAECKDTRCLGPVQALRLFYFPSAKTVRKQLVGALVSPLLPAFLPKRVQR